MRFKIDLALLFGLLFPPSAAAQAVEARHLVMSVGGGAGMLNMASDDADLADQGVESGALRFAFGYAFSPRWSLGIHYDRIGTAYHGGILEHLHVTNYLVEGTYRPWVGQRAMAECTFGVGASVLALFPYGARLPYTGNGATVSVGVRYGHMITHTLGFFAAADHAASSSNALEVNGGVVDPDGTATHVQWNSQRITAGMLVRF
ncbi:MAG TPA: hypothetical protein PLB89_14645 [Flavobacteriales bacterium]|nr:hypothetical protein [Flavobacteriales bacterium]